MAEVSTILALRGRVVFHIYRVISLPGPCARPAAGHSCVKSGDGLQMQADWLVLLRMRSKY